MRKLLILLLFIVYTLSSVSGQEVPVVVTPGDSVKVSSDTLKVSADIVKDSISPARISPDVAAISKNCIKFNITSALMKNYSLQYERVLTRTISVALTYRIMPESHIPYADNMISWFNITDPDAQYVIKNLNMANYTITPEIRFYTGKKRYGRGFYFALFYRYGNYTINNALIPYDTDRGERVTINSAGSVSSHTGGFMMGAQWALGKYICLDWWILGPHFGISSGDFAGLSSAPLSEVDQQDIADNLNNIDIPMFKQTVNVTADKVTMIFDGPWGGIRAGLSIGVRF